MKRIITFLTCTIVVVIAGFTIMMGFKQEEIVARNIDNYPVNQQTSKKVPSSNHFLKQQQTTPESVTKEKNTMNTTEQDEIEKTTNIKAEESQIKENSEDNNLESQSIEELTHTKIIELVDGFSNTINKLLEDIDDDFRLVNYNSKEEIKKVFLPYSLPGVADPYMDRYFEEIDGALYGLPQDGSRWFEHEIQYSLENQSEEKIILTQINTKNDFFGPYTIKIEFNYYQNQWKISHVSVESN